MDPTGLTADFAVPEREAASPIAEEGFCVLKVADRGLCARRTGPAVRFGLLLGAPPHHARRDTVVRDHRAVGLGGRSPS